MNRKCPKNLLRFLLLFNFLIAFIADILNYDEYFRLFIVIMVFIMLIKNWKNPPDIKC